MFRKGAEHTCADGKAAGVLPCKPPNFAPFCRFRADRMRKTAVFRQSCRQAQSSASRFRESKKAPMPGCFFCFGGSGEIREEERNDDDLAIFRGVGDAAPRKERHAKECRSSPLMLWKTPLNERGFAGGSGEIRTRGRLPVTAFRVRLVMTTSIRFQSASYFTITRAVLQVFERCSAFKAGSLRRAGVQERGEAAHRDGKCASRREPFLRRGNNIISADSYFPA